MGTTSPYRPATLLLAGLLAGVAAGGCAPAARGAPEAAPASAEYAQGPDAARARARADSARRPYTTADIRFMTDMIGHHAQAITMARWAPTHGASDQVRTLAARIVNAQRDEIVTMQQWLRDRGQPVPQVTETGALTMPGDEHAMHMAGGGMASMDMSHAHMPGMLSDDQMHELDAARGRDFDRLFLRYMIQHHRGAVSMVKDLFSSYGAGQDELVFKFASDVNVDQTTEINRMEQMLLAIALEGYATEPPGSR